MGECPSDPPTVAAIELDRSRWRKLVDGKKCPALRGKFDRQQEKTAVDEITGWKERKARFKCWSGRSCCHERGGEP